MKVLLIEDNPTLLYTYQIKLVINGFEVLTAADGEEGLSTALQNRPDLILLDILLPKMDGFVLMQKLRENSWGKTVPIIILTNLDTNDKITQIIAENKPSGYLIKANTTPEEVVNHVREVLKMQAPTKSGS